MNIWGEETRAVWQPLDAAGELRDAWDARAREILTDADFETDAAHAVLTQELARAIAEATPKALAPPFGELLAGALAKVNWRAIAGAILERVELWAVGWFRADAEAGDAMDPERFLSNAEARAYLADVIENLDTDDEAKRSTYADIAGELRADAGDFRETLDDGFVYWIKRE